jgi:hypothetical protein
MNHHSRVGPARNRSRVQSIPKYRFAATLQVDGTKFSIQDLKGSLSLRESVFPAWGPASGTAHARRPDVGGRTLAMRIIGDVLRRFARVEGLFPLYKGVV